MAETTDAFHEVVIIGAGVAGLRCAHQLIHEKGVTDVLVVEAMDRIGGRILPNTDFIPGMTVEVGAEMLHGANTTLTKLAEEQKWSLREIFTWAQGDGGPTEPAPDGGIGYYYLGDQKRMLAYDDTDPDFCHFNDAVEQLCEIEDIDAIPSNESMLDYFRKCNISESMMRLADAGYANTAGSRLDDISLRITCRYERQWIELEDDGDYRIVPTFGRVIDFFKQGVSVQLSWPVATIDHTDPQRIVLTSKSGERLSCRKLVVTVPTSVFLDIEYLPELPEAKQVAVRSFGMRRAAKVFMHFTDSFWPANTHGVICSDCFLPEFWVNSTQGVGELIENGDEEYPASKSADQEVQYLVTGFAGADCADRLHLLTEEEIVSRFLSQLDMIYATEENPTPATKAFVKGMYLDWGDVDYVKGGYSYPRVGQTDHASKDLADSIDNRIFFAGEATSFEQPGMSVHSAMDTGSRAAKQVAESLNHP
ncbi:hypothetical protein Poli38472_006560 [Pythium oligandrum]|uniref:Amine oxidase domain-containing protein n=1 Tax=Pythium oligandrum TaxID=41045 RepID=A0A8K1FAT3_PYTOL|nr:hypothetical protein Poli38472_006560 [Pythium oligandrum]|eukprot:TMW56550.1 hypothetical protein Poli38472_006560 [Pythium oligandrum]